jgi:hypothetical protein
VEVVTTAASAGCGLRRRDHVAARGVRGLNRHGAWRTGPEIRGRHPLAVCRSGAEVADGAPLTGDDRRDDTYITSNVLVNNDRNIVRTQRENGLGATGATIAHNVIVGGGPAA